jgi:hypothetical protein
VTTPPHHAESRRPGKADRVQAALDSVLGERARANHLTAAELVQAATAVENAAVGTTHTRAGFIGTRVIVRGAEATHKKWGVTGTSALVERRESGWRLVEVTRGLIFPGQHWIEAVPSAFADARYLTTRLSERARRAV